MFKGSVEDKTFLDIVPNLLVEFQFLGLIRDK